jgi:sn-glycerol 3-phosphate transport system ATP-binding protein
MAAIELRNVVKRYGSGPKANQVVHGVSAQINDGEFVVIVGPSGCGKSTLLRMVAGLEAISEGEIAIGGRVVNDIPPDKRDVAMVFQNYALYPHMTVFDNMAYGLKIAKMPKEHIRTRVENVAKSLELTDYLERLPKALSGGQRQRVAMGRAIVRQPQVFLFDEPLSNLDAKLRSQTRIEIQRLHRDLGVTSLFVTHDQMEAMTLAQRMIVLNAGRVEQFATPEEIYLRPASVFVAGFIGSPPMNLVKVNVDRGTIRGDGFSMFNPTPGLVPKSVPDGGFAILGCRPEHIEAVTQSSAVNVMGGGLPARCELVELLGAERLVHARLGTQLVTVRLDEGRVAPHPGEHFLLRPRADRLHWFDVGTGMRIE